jgi:hypothetical protein
MAAPTRFRFERSSRSKSASTISPQRCSCATLTAALRLARRWQSHGSQLLELPIERIDHSEAVLAADGREADGVAVLDPDDLGAPDRGGRNRWRREFARERLQIQQPSRAPGGRAVHSASSHVCPTSSCPKLWCGSSRISW